MNGDVAYALSKDAIQKATSASKIEEHIETYLAGNPDLIAPKDGSITLPKLSPEVTKLLNDITSKIDLLDSYNFLYPVLLSEAKTVVNIQYPYGDVRRYGAVGDGVTDDSIAIQNAVNCNDYIYFEEGKQYRFVKNGLFIRRNTHLIGNNATLFIDDGYDPNNNEFSLGRFIRYTWAASQIYDTAYFENINIESRRTQKFTHSDAHIVLLDVYYYKRLIMKNCTLKVNEVQDSYHCLFVSQCSEIEIIDCSMINLAAGAAGNVFWATSRNYPITKLNVQNCYFEGYCSDEIIALWGEKSITNAVFSNCRFIGSNKYFTHSTRAIAIYNGEYGTDVRKIITFRDCYFSLEDDVSNSNFYQSLCGIGSSNSDEIINVYFSHCLMECDIRLCLFMSQGIPANVSSWSTNTNLMITLDNSSVITNKPLAGSYPMNDIPSSVCFSGIRVNDSTIRCRNALILEPNTDNYSKIIQVTNSDIYITDAQYIYWSFFNINKNKLIFINDRIITDTPIVSIISLAKYGMPKGYQSDATDVRLTCDVLLNNYFIEDTKSANSLK